MIVRLCINGVFYYPTLLGISARLQTEGVRNWELPPDTALVDFYILEIYGAAMTHPESCSYVANLILESTLSESQLMSFYRHSAPSWNVFVEVTEPNNQYKVSLSVREDPAWGYYCNHGFGSIPTTPDSGA